MFRASQPDTNPNINIQIPILLHTPNPNLNPNPNPRFSGHLDLKFRNFVPFLHIFDRFCGFLNKKGKNCEILNLNNWRLVRLKVHVIQQKSL